MIDFPQSGRKKPRYRESGMSEDVEGKDETKLANGGGAFPFWVSVAIVGGLFVVLVAIVYGVVELIA